MMELTHYLTPGGHDPFQSWLDATKEKDRQAAMRILTRLNRLVTGNAGDARLSATECWNCVSTTGLATVSTTPG